MFKPRVAIVCILGLAAVVSCGGGGGGGGSSPSAPTTAPTASPTATPTPNSEPACTDTDAIRRAFAPGSRRPYATATPVSTPTPCHGFMEFPLTSTTSGPTSIAPGQTYPSVSDSNVWIAETAANDLIAVSPYGAISQTVTLPGGTNPMFLAQLWSQSASTCCIAYQWMILEPASSGIAVVTPGSAALPTQISPPTVGAVLSGSASGIGPSGLAVWFSESNVNKVAELGTSDPTYPVATEFTLPTANAGPTVMGQGSDGNMWVYESLTNKLAQISSAGVITEYPLLSAKAGVSAISAAAGKTSPYAIYIAETTANKIASVTTTGAIVEYPIPVAKSGVNALTVDTSGNVWFTEPGVNMIGEMSPSGAFSPGYTVPTSNAGLAGISLGNRGTTTLQQECCADNRIWFTEQTAGKVGVYSQ